ncbi:MAG: hypothetical protein KJ072_08335 [Verrucomicrobia bacterium]|nr:hypothetical protein [Verrucomicrobiota bacterium]
MRNPDASIQGPNKVTGSWFLPAPRWQPANGTRPPDEKTGVTLTFPAPEVTGEVAGEVKRLLAVVNGELKRQEIQAQLGLRHEEHFRAAIPHHAQAQSPLGQAAALWA